MARPRKSTPEDIAAPGEAPDDLYDYARPPARRPGRPAPEDPTTWTVTDDWPVDVPVTEAEIEVFEAWFGDLFDELLRGWAIRVLQDAGAIRECEHHGWMQDRSDPHARERAFAVAREDPPPGVSAQAAAVAIAEVLDSIGDTCPECVASDEP